MAENTGSSGVSIVAIIVVGALILFFAWFFVLRGGGDDADIEVEVPKPTQSSIQSNWDAYAKLELPETVQIA
jgi:hypothetical protein